MADSIGTNLLNAVLKDGQVVVLRDGAAEEYTLTIQTGNQRSPITSIEVVQQDPTVCLALTSDNSLYLLNLLTGTQARLCQLDAGLNVNSMTTSPGGDVFVVTEKKRGFRLGSAAATGGGPRWSVQAGRKCGHQTVCQLYV